MFKDIKWLRLVPDRSGRGGTKTGIHTFQQTPVNDTYSIDDVHVYRGAWRRDFDSIAAGAIAGNFEIGSQTPLALHGYVFPSLTDPAAAPGLTVFSHHDVAGAKRVWDQTNGVIRSLRPGAATTQAGIFQNVNGRCFYGDGAAEGMVFDDRTPAIHAQPNQPIGVGTPPQGLSNVVLYSDPNITPLGTGYAHYQSHYLNHPNADNMLGTCKIGDAVVALAPNPNYPYYVGGLSGFTLLADAVSSNTSVFTATGTVSIVTGTSLITLTGATWPVDFQYAGLTINFNGYSFVILTHGWPANPFVSNYDVNGNPVSPTSVQLYLLGTYDGPTITAPGVPYSITGCQVTLDPASKNTVLVLNAGTLGYGQSTASMLFQVTVRAVRTGGLYRNLGNISLGPVGGGSPHTVTDFYIEAGFTSGFSYSNPFVSTDVGKSILIDKADTNQTMLFTTIAAVGSTGSIIGLASSGQPPGLVTQTATRAWWLPSMTGVNDATVAGNTLTSPSNPWSITDVGKEVMIAKALDGTSAYFGHITAFATTGSVTVTPAVGSNQAAIQAYWGGGTANTYPGPTYAYAWYDPETGHCSNISPLYQIPRPTEQGQYADFANLTPIFRIDPGYISYPDPVDAVRFSHLMFFRTLSTPGSSTLYPIGSLMPFISKVRPGLTSTRGSWNPSTFKGWMGLPNNMATAPPLYTGPNYWYDFSSDSDLLLSGGFRAPQFTNSKPIALLRGGVTQPGRPYALAYWDRRTWLVNTQEPTKIAFSCDEAQCPLGVPEESFPPTNFLRLPSVDGKVIGMRTVGDLLLITTQRWAYIIAGNNESNYRLLKVSASMPGVGHYQMDEMPTITGAEGEPSTLFYLGQDRIVYQWTMGGQPIPISLPIQNQLDPTITSLTTYQLARVHCVSAFGRRLVIVQPPAGAAARFRIYDVDNQVWSTSTPTDGTGGLNFGAPTPMTTIHGLNPPVNELYSIFTPTISAVIVRSWIRDDVVTSTAPLVITTFPINFDGKKTRKRLLSVNIHATAGTYSLRVLPNESSLNSTPQVNFTAYPDPLDSVYGAPPLTTLDGSGSQDSVVMSAQFYGDSMPLIAYRFVIIIFRQDTSPGTIYALDIGYKDEVEPGDGDA